MTWKAWGIGLAGVGAAFLVPLRWHGSVIKVHSSIASGEERQPKSLVSQLGSYGSWRLDSDPPETRRTWQVHVLEFDDGSVQARVAVPGGGRFASMTLQGQVENRGVFGSLMDEGGTQLDTFEAEIDLSGGTGTFTLGSGERGSWIDATVPTPELDPTEPVPTLTPLEATPAISPTVQASPLGGTAEPSAAPLPTAAPDSGMVPTVAAIAGS